MKLQNLTTPLVTALQVKVLEAFKDIVTCQNPRTA